jgi:ABC-type Fe3+/spermidine/putrescine transport system ATPase subunit
MTIQHAINAPQGVQVEGLRKNYGQVVAVDGVTLTVQAGTVLALLGPSGSGKTTILSCIAGFERVEKGRIVIGAKDVSRMPPHERGIGMVFQRYALFPHMTVAENIAYPLRQRGISRADRDIRVRRKLDLMQLSAMGDRSPAQLSGGQQQRVALARALVYDPPVLLMDEPLGALDRKLRDELQIEIKQLQRRLDITAILVTHDQQEALSMADQIVLLRGGRIVQAGSPRELHDEPVSAYVAEFVGGANRLHGIAEAGGTRVRLPSGIVLAGRPTRTAPQDGQPAELVIRLGQVSADPAGHVARVVETAYSGETITLILDLYGTTLLARRPSAETQWVVGEVQHVGWSPDQAWIFPAERDH